MKIKDFNKIDLPREKFEKHGQEKLFDYELLAILLGSGIKGVNVIQLSKKILSVIKKVSIKNIDINSLIKIKGLGKIKAIQVLSIIELTQRFGIENPEILSAEDIWKLCSDIRDSKKEHFVVFYLDTKNKLIERQIVSIGTLNASLVHPRELFEPAISLHAVSVIIAHNHPSGDTSPSPEDIEVTKRLVDAGKILGIEVVDHLIVSKDNYFSFKDKMW